MEFPSEALLPQKTIFYKGASGQIAAEALGFGRAGVIVHGRSLDASPRLDAIMAGFPADARVERFVRGSGEPSLDEVNAIRELARSVRADWIAGIGGGSAIDAAKAAAGLFNAVEPPSYYQEGGALLQKGIPLIAVPTTAGSGAEASPNAVIINQTKNLKLSIRDKTFVARTVILDCDLLRSLPLAQLNHSALDALVQAVESYISKNASTFSEMLALRAIELINENIMAVQHDCSDQPLASLLVASYYAGIAFSHSRLGVIHGLAHPLGAIYDLPHGLVCAAAFAPAVRYNRGAMGGKYAGLSDRVGMDFLERIEMLLADLNIESPFTGKRIIEREKIITETLKSGSTAANPRAIRRHDVECLLEQLFR